MPKLVIGNWKMNMDLSSSLDLLDGIKLESQTNCEVVICPPHVYIHAIAQAAQQKQVALGGQNCAGNRSGAYTGEVSAGMLQDVGCEYVILGHSERREQHKENNAEIAQKVSLAQEQGLTTIVCVGESLEVNESGHKEEYLLEQLAESLPQNYDAGKTIIAYEPVWAIGSGLTPTRDEIGQVVEMIKTEYEGKIPVVYGGSVNAQNVGELKEIKGLDGFLVGGASIKANEFSAIIDGM